MPRLLVLSLVVASLVLTAVPSRTRADEPLHVRIDEKIDAAADWVAPRSGDSEFVRRLHLDLVGRIPTVDETRAFLADDAADKRTQLVDRLLAGPEHPRRMQELFHVMLMERRGDDEHWERFLRASFEKNRPWDEFVRTILKPDATNEEDRGAAYFMTNRLGTQGANAPIDVPGLTRDVGRMFAGIDLQCCQCHDHIDVTQYEQRDFQGLNVVFENVKPGRGAVPEVTEGLLSEPVDFLSVFTQVPMQTGPVVPGGGEIAIPAYAKGEEYLVAPDRKLKIEGVPKFSPLRELANGLTTAENEFFTRNIVNRLWFAMLGRGLVEPLDLQHGDNPASHPELFDLLAAEFAAHDFDMRWFVRELVLTETYQRTSLLPADREPPAETTYAVALEKRLSAEQLFRSTLIATGEFDRLWAAAKTEKGDAPRTFDVTKLVAKNSELVELSKKFLDAYANPPAEPEIDFEPTVAAALLVLHDDRVLALFAPRDGNLADRLTKLPDDDSRITEIFLTVLAREPDAEERSLASTHAEHLDRLAWALIASTEFQVNH